MGTQTHKMSDTDVPPGSAETTTMRWASSFFFICFLLWLGLQLRHIKFFRIFSLPAAVSGGIIGLIILQLFKLNESFYELIQYDWIVGWSALPGILINVVFATLFLGKELPKSAKQVWQEGGPQIMYGQMIAWGNWTISCLLTGAILIPAFGVSPLFASMYAVGFEGGHGTAAGLSESYTALGQPTYGDIAVTSATIGILCGCFIGVVIVNWGISTGRLENRKDGTIVAAKGVDDEEKEENQGESERKGCCTCKGNPPPDIYDKDEQPSAGKQTVRQDAIESLALHLVYIAFSCFIGYGILRLLWLIEDAVPALQQIKFFRSFPLFPMCMLGGLLVMWVRHKLGCPFPVDDLLMDRIGGAAMEFLIVSAIALINISAVADNLAPLFIIIIGGMTWNFFCFFYLKNFVLPNYKFERAIVELGQSFGTTATGLLLLRMVDPDKETPVWRSFGFKQLVTEPFMGGGVWTTVSLPLLATIGVWGVFGIASGALTFWFGMYFFYFRRMYKQMETIETHEDEDIKENV